MICSKILKSYFSVYTFKRNPVRVTFSTLLILALLSQFLDLPAIIESFLGLPMLVLLPILSGNALIYTVERIWIRSSKNAFSEIGFIPNLIFEWFLGFYFIYTFLFLLLLHTQNITLGMAIMVVVCGVGAWRLEHQMLAYGRPLLNKKSLLLLAALMIIGLIPISIIKFYQTFPLPPARSFTVGGHLYRFVYNIAEHGIPDTPYDITHPPSLNLLYGLVSRMFAVDPLSLFWSTPFLLLVILSLGMFLFAYELSSKKGLALIASLVGVWILSATNAANWPVAPEAAYVIYSMNPLVFYLFLKFGTTKNLRFSGIVASLVLSLIFVASLKISVGLSSFIVFYQIIILLYLFVVLLLLKTSSNFVFPFIINLALVATHTYHGPATIFTASSVLFFSRLNTIKKSHVSSMLQSCLVVFASIFIGLQLLQIVQLPVNNVISSFLGLKEAKYATFYWKFEQLIIGTSDFVFILFFLGTLLLLLSRNVKERAISVATVFVLLIYFWPENWSYRLIDVLSPLMAYAIASAIYKIAELAV